MVEMVQKKVFPFSTTFLWHYLWALRALILVTLKKKGVFIKLCQHNKGRKGYFLLSSE